MSNNKKTKTSNSPNNYFLNEDGKKAAKYKLWCGWLPEYIGKWQGKKSTVWFGLNKRRNEGLDWLFQKAKSLRTEFRVAIIYDNQTGKELYRIPGCDLSALNPQQTETNI